MSITNKKIDLIKECYKDLISLEDKYKLLNEIKTNESSGIFGFDNLYNINSMKQNLELTLGKLLLMDKNE